MDELYTLVFGICGALFAVEVISRLFPENSGELVRGIAVLCILAVLISGIVKAEFGLELQWEDTFTPDAKSAQDQAAESGTALLRERLHGLLETAGIKTADGAEGIEVRYRQQDSGEIEIDRVCVALVYRTDTDRAFALLRSVLTEAIPLEIYTE